MIRLVLVLVLALDLALACSPPPRPPPADTTYPGTLHPPSELSPDFVVEQHIEATKNDRHGGFDAVLQKRGGELTVVGLGPLGVRAFVLRQEGSDATFEQTMGPPLPFPPRNVLVDIHRAFFKRLPLPEGGTFADGVHRGVLDDEEVVETWQGGSLAERRFLRKGQAGAVRLTYGKGCTAARCEPDAVRLVNEWFGYEIRIENRRYHFLD